MANARPGNPISSGCLSHVDPLTQGIRGFCDLITEGFAAQGQSSQDKENLVRIARLAPYLSNNDMRGVVFLAVCGLAFAQPPDPAYEPLTRAYEALRGRDYENRNCRLPEGDRSRPRAAPPSTKTCAYTYLKSARTSWPAASSAKPWSSTPTIPRWPWSTPICASETKERQQARRIFDRVRKTGDATAERAFAISMGPLAAGIERWKKAIEMGADNFSAHFELATLAEERDELALAAEHYEKAWRLLPDRRSVLWTWATCGWRSAAPTTPRRAAGRFARGRAACAEAARELLPRRYPFVASSGALWNWTPPTSSYAASWPTCCCAWISSRRPNGIRRAHRKSRRTICWLRRNSVSCCTPEATILPPCPV